MYGFPGGTAVKNPPADTGDLSWIPDQEDPLEKEMATRSSIPAWKIPWTEEPGGLQCLGLQRVGHDWTQQQGYMMNLYCPLLGGALTHGTHCSYLDNIVDKNIRSLKKYLSQFTDVRILETETLTKYSSVELLSRSTDVPSIEIVPFCKTSRNVCELVKISVLNIKHRYEASQDNGFSVLSLQCSKKYYFYRRQHDIGNRIDKDDICLLVVRLYPVSN